MPFVDIRRWYTKGNKTNLCPTLVGIALTFTQWNVLKEVAKLDVMKKQFEDVKSCWHFSQRKEELCRECIIDSP